MLADKGFYRSANTLGPAYEHADRVEDATIEMYLLTHLANAWRTGDLERFLAAFDCSHTVSIEAKLRNLQAPTLIVWGSDDVYFDVKWSHWLANTIPGTRRRLEFDGARLFFPAERRNKVHTDALLIFAGNQIRCSPLAPDGAATVSIRLASLS